MWIYQAASNLIGSRYTGLHPLGSVEDHVWICDDAEIEVLAVHPLFVEVGRAVLERSTSVRHLLVFGECEVGENLYSLMADHEPRPLEPGPATEDDVSWLQALLRDVSGFQIGDGTPQIQKLIIARDAIGPEVMAR